MIEVIRPTQEQVLKTAIEDIQMHFVQPFLVAITRIEETQDGTVYTAQGKSRGAAACMPLRIRVYPPGFRVEFI